MATLSLSSNDLAWYDPEWDVPTGSGLCPARGLGIERHRIIWAARKGRPGKAGRREETAFL